jgi:cell division transport system permease protein
MNRFKKILGDTKKNVTRNRWMSISTIFVISLVFTISSFFIATSIIASKAVDYYETRAQVMIFFKRETPEEEIFAFRDGIKDSELIDSIEYISQEDALAIYKEDFENEPDLIDTITADTLPPSLGVRATSIENLEEVIKTINTEKEKNAYVDEVFYFKDVVDNLKTLSKVITYGASTLIIGLGTISFVLIMITIGFNILAHKDEIEIMHLVGSPESFIKTPFLTEGAFYGILGALISSFLILVPWYLIVTLTSGTDFSFWTTQFLNDLGLDFLGRVDIIFITAYTLVQVLVGALFGAISSYTAVLKYLRLNEK